MRKGGGKAKGAQFEREVAVALSKWASHGGREDCFWRSAMSGGRATIAKRKGRSLSAHAGDLTCTHPLGEPFLSKFYVELKNYKDLQYQGLVTGAGHLVKFWQSTVTEANCFRKEPMLIAKQNHLPPLVCINRASARLLRVPYWLATVIAPRINLHGYTLNDFVRYAQPP